MVAQAQGAKGIMDLYRCTPRQARAFIIDILEAGLVPYLESSPGMGKSTIIHSIGSEAKLFKIDHRLSTSAPEDLSGLPHFNKLGQAMFAPFVDLFPIEGTPIPDGCEGWLLFLDEFNAAPRNIQAAAYKLILDKMVGQKRLHSQVAIAAAGNLATDKAITNPLSTAMQSRLIHLEMTTDFDEWLEDVAFKYNFDQRVIAYLSAYKDKFMDFRPDHHEKTFCCPRTWEFVHKLIKDKPELPDSFAILLAGTITSGVAADFVQFCKVYKELVSISEILRDPETCRLPQENNERWATITMMMSEITEKNFKDLSKYADRFGLDFRILFYRSVIVRHMNLRTHPAFASAMVALSRYLHD
jgi:hypothetical protein